MLQDIACVVCIAHSTGLCEACSHLSTLFLFSSRSVVTNWTSQGGTLPAFILWPIKLFKTTIFSREGFINFFQYKMEMMTSYCCQPGSFTSRNENVHFIILNMVRNCHVLMLSSEHTDSLTHESRNSGWLKSKNERVMLYSVNSFQLQNWKHIKLMPCLALYKFTSYRR